MGNERNIPKEILFRIKELIEKNENPNRIKTIIEKEFNRSYAYNTINSKIKKIFKLEWDKNSRIYKDVEHKPPVQGQLDLFNYIPENKDNNITNVKENSKSTADLNSLNTDSITNENHNDSSINLAKEKLDLERKDDETKILEHEIRNENFERLDTDEKLGYILNYLETMNKNIVNLNTRIKRMESFINNLKQDNPYNKIKAMAEDFINIYASEKSKKSVNINEEIKDRIVKYIAENYGIKNNTSLAINTALLISLYKSNEKNEREGN